MVLVLFYSSDSDPFRSCAHSVQLPIDDSLSALLGSSPGKWHASLSKFRHWIELEVGYAFECTDAERTAKRFLDEDGDPIVLDNDESFREALKTAARLGGTLRILVDAPLKKGKANEPPLAPVRAAQETCAGIKTVVCALKVTKMPVSHHFLQAAAAATAPIPEMTRPHSQSLDSSLDQWPTEPPSWLRDCISQVKVRF